jgi:GT2 family glycosyltransferase
MQKNNSETVSAVVLSFSREKVFFELINALRTQSVKLDDIIVINQGNNVKILSWLAEQNDLIVVNQNNLGSAGGFCRGIQESIRRGHGWTWIFDDDAIPEKIALKELVDCPYFSRKETVFLSSRIIDRNGRTYMSAAGGNGMVLENKFVEATDGCWLGLLVRTQAVLMAGLPISEFFLWDEDREFISRLVKHGKGYCVLNSVITHYQDTHFDPFGKDFIKVAYYARNHVARAKISSAPWWKKVLKTIRVAVSLLLRILKREWPIRVAPWIFKGVFLFWPKIKYIKSEEPTKIKSMNYSL